MTIDNDTQVVVYRSLAEVMSSYSERATRADLEVLSIAVTESSRKYVQCLKRGRIEEATGHAVKLEAYADKLASFTKRLATVGENSW